MVYNVGVLVDGFNARLYQLDQDIEELTSEVGWTKLQVSNAQERAARRKIRNLTTKKKEDKSEPAVQQFKKKTAAGNEVNNNNKAYARKPIDYSALDHIGVGGITAVAPSSRNSSRASSLMLEEAPE